VNDIDRRRYNLLYGPTAGDRIRLADTDLLIKVDEDRCAGGDEAVFGGGKVIRESMGQSRATRADGAADTVITGAVVLDHCPSRVLGAGAGAVLPLAGPGLQVVALAPGILALRALLDAGFTEASPGGNRAYTLVP